MEKICNQYIGINSTHGITDYNSLEKWLETLSKKKKVTKDKKTTKKITVENKQKKKLSYMEKRELESMEENVQALAVF